MAVSDQVATAAPPLSAVGKDASVTKRLFSLLTAESAGNAIKAFIPLIREAERPDSRLRITMRGCCVLRYGLLPPPSR